MLRFKKGLVETIVSLGNIRGYTLNAPMRFPWEDPSVSMFDVWIGQPELAWARKAWIALERRGLTLFSNELERTRVLIRAMTLGTIYREFCDLAHDDAWDSEYQIWAAEMGLNSFRVAQLAGDEFELDDDFFCNRCTRLDGLLAKIY